MWSSRVDIPASFIPRKRDLQINGLTEGRISLFVTNSNAGNRKFWSLCISHTVITLLVPSNEQTAMPPAYL
jgi:hypothetical protein